MSDILFNTQYPPAIYLGDSIVKNLRVGDSIVWPRTPSITPTASILMVTPSLSISATPSLSISVTPSLSISATRTPSITPSYSAQQIITDDFEAYTPGTSTAIHHLTTNWSGLDGSVYVWELSSNNFIYNGSSGNMSSAIRTETFSDNHSAKITLLSVSTEYAGVICRAQSVGNFYLYYVNNNNRLVAKVINGVPTNFYSYYGTVSNGDTIELRVSGNTLTCLYNGNPDTSLVSGGSFTDDTYTSGGSPGVFFYGSDDFGLDDFVAANI